MIKIKHLMDAVEKDDGQRIWVEPINLTRDLQEWCQVGHLLCQVGPPKELWDWFQWHQQGYEFFRGGYHAWLANSPYRPALQQLACAAMHETSPCCTRATTRCRTARRRCTNSSANWARITRRKCEQVHILRLVSRDAPAERVLARCEKHAPLSRRG